MTKQYFEELAAYNAWANGKAIQWLQQIDDEQWEQPLVSSFENIAATVLHVAGAESIWLQRFKKVKSPVWLTTVFTGGKTEALQTWQEQSEGFKKLISGFDETALTDTFRFTRLNGEVHQLQYYQAFAHVVNHSSYHRGQLVTMLRQVGFTAVTSTDLSTFYSK
jgi:uncharacterized damage-inducible protein DinB